MAENPFLEIIDNKAKAELEATGNQPKQAGESNPFISLIDQQQKDQGTVFRSAMSEATETDPDAYAKQVGLSKRTGLPVDVVARNQDKVEKQAPFLSGEYDDLVQTHPATTKFLSADDNAKYAKDDIEHLTVMEQITKMNDTQNLFKMFGDSFLSGLNQINVGIAQAPATAYNAYAALYNLAAIPQNQIAQALGRPDQTVQLGTSPDWLLNNPVSQYYKKAAEYYAPEELHQDPIQLMREGNGPQAARAIAAQVVANLPQQLFLVGATIAGQPQIGLAGMGALSASQATAEAQDNGKTPLMATMDAFGQGGIEVLTERFGTVGIVQHWENALIKSFGKTTATQVLKDVGKSIAAAFFQEGAEELVASVGQDFTDYVTGNPKALDGYAQRAMNAFLVGAFSGGIVTAPTVLTSAGIKSYEAAKDGKFWDEMIGTSEASKLRQRSPDKYEKFVDNLLVENGRERNVYVSYDAVKTFFQNDNEGLQKFVEEMGLNDQLAEASNAGKEFEISAAKFAAKYAGSPLSAALRQDMRFKVDGMTQREQVQVQQEYAKLVQEMQAEYATLVQEQKLPPEIQSMRDKMILPKDIGGAGLSAEDADAQLSVFVSGLRNFARKSGVPFEEYVRKINPVLNVGGASVTPGANTFNQQGSFKLTPDVLASVNWGKVNTYMKRKGYDFRGAEDAKEIFKRMASRDPNNELTASVFPDHIAALEYGTMKKVQTLESKAKRTFGVTPYLEEAGYLTKDGALLDFSGRRDGYVGPPDRNVDHREIHRVYPDDAFPEDNVGTKNMIDFMNRGNIRLQSNGIDISILNTLTPAQERVLGRHIAKNRGEYTVDFSDANGNTADSKDYPIGTSAAKIIKDIRDFLAANNAKTDTFFQTDELGFFSKLRNVIEEKMPNSAPAQQIEGILSGSGVKQEEVEWMGLKEFIAGKSKVTKEELLQFIDGNTIQLKEVTLGYKPNTQLAQKQKQEVVRDSEEERRRIQRKAEQLQEADFQAASEDWFNSYDYGHYTPPNSDIEELDVDSEELDWTDAEKQAYQDRVVRADAGLPDLFGEKRNPVLAPGWKATFDGEDLGIYKTEAEAQDAFDEARNEYDQQIQDSDYEEFQRDWFREHDLESYEEQAREELGIEEDGGVEGQLTPRFKNYILDNGANYREVLLTLPFANTLPAGYTVSENPFKNNGASKFIVLGPGEAPNNRYASGSTAEEAIKQFNINHGKTFSSSHFDQKNIVAHFRLTERDTPLGRTLFIEEIQSDWHQQGREKGYRKNLSVKSREELERRANEIEQFGIAEKAQGRDIPSEMKQEWADIRNTLENKGVADAPFKKTWHELAAKRILRMAVEEGYDALAWTTGQQQVERYENALKDAVDKIEWKKTEQGVQLIGYKKSRYVTPSGNDVPGAPASYDEVVNTTEKETALSDAIGKAMAQQIISSPDQSGVIEGDSITISDTGMAGFYDRIIPQFLSKYTKKWGGKVGETQIDTKATVEKPADEQGRKFLGIADVKETVHSLPITQQMKDSVSAEGQPLFQDDAAPRGSIQFTNAATTINLYKSANLSTFLHETGHLFMREMKNLIDAGAADPQMVIDYETLRKFVGGNIESRAAQEKLARAFEAYLREGRAPSVKLVEAFRRFRDWLTAIYRTVRGLNVEITEEIRDVFDRVLAAEAEIEEAKQFYANRKSLLDLIPVTPEQKAKVKKAKNDSDQAALEKAVKERLNIYLRLQGGKQAIREQATKDIDNTPVYTAINDAIEKGGMDARVLEDQFGKETVKKLRELHDGVAKYEEKTKNKKGTFDPAKAPSLPTLAVKYGFPTPEALVQQMLKARPRSQAITARSKEILAQKEQELLQDLKGDEKVLGEEAIHNEKSLTYLITEAEILSQKLAAAKNRRPDQIEEKLYRSVAQEVISKKTVKQAIRYDLYARAEQRYAKQAEAAIIANDFETALILKKKQLINHALVLEAIKARDEKKKVENFFKAKNYKAKLNRTEYDFAEAAMDITSTYQLGTGKDLVPKNPGALDKIKDIDEFLAMTIPEWIRLKTLPPNFKDYRDLTMDQFRQLDDAVKAILQYGSDEMKSIEAGEAKTLKEWVDASVTEMQKLKDRNFTVRDESNGIIAKALDKIDAFESVASLLQFTTDWMDNFSFFKNGKAGPFKKLYNKVLQAEIKYTKLREAVVKETKKSWDVLAKASSRIEKERGAFFDIQGVPLNEDMRRTKRAFWNVNRAIAFLLNTGNAGNLESIKKAYGYTDRQIQAVASIFTAEELNAIQQIWDATDTLYPELDETHFAIYNRHLPKVLPQSIAFVSKDGVDVSLKGGYYPLIFDHKISDQAAKFQEEDLMKNQTQAVIRSSKPEDGMTYARTPGHSLPPLLETSVWFNHINATARYISHARILRDLNRFTRDKEWSKEMKKKAGDDHYKNIRAWLQYNANPARRLYTSKLDMAADWLKSLSTAAVLGFKTAVGLKQRVALINAAQAMGRDKLSRGWGWILKAYREVDFRVSGLGLAQSKTWEEILKKSEYLKLRDGNIDREISDMRRGIQPLQKKLKIGNKEFTPKDIQDFAFEWIKMNDRAVVSVVWTAAYNQYIQEKADAKDTPDAAKKAAVAYADGIVQDTQASSLTPELSSMQRQEGWLRLFTSFMTSSVNYGNRIIQNYRAWSQGSITNKEFFNHVLQEYLAMPYAAYAISLALRGGDDEPEWWQFLLVPIESLFSFVPVIRDVFSYWNYGTDIGKTTVFEPLARTAKAVKSTGQWIFGDNDFTQALWDIGRAVEVYTKVPALNFVKEITDNFEKLKD